MCNCNGSKAAQQFKYVYVSATGKRTEYTNEVQARAAQIREKNETGRYGTYDKVPA